VNYIRILLLVCIIGAAAAPLQAVQVLPGQGVIFRQLDFTFTSASQANSDYGMVIVDFLDVSYATGISDGYLNIESSQGWVVRNMPVILNSDHPGWSTMFDLGSAGHIDSIHVHVDLSLTPTTSFSGTPDTWFPVYDLEFNAEGRNAPRTSVPASIDLSTLVYDPFGIIHHAFQLSAPNVEQDKNQCGPASVANSLQWLEDKYAINMPHLHIPGIRDGSLVGELDKDMQRQPHETVTDTDALNGKLRYLDDNGLGPKLDIKHKNRIGQSFVSNANVTVGKTTSKADNSATSLIDWVISELEAGEDVELAIGWDSGGGHWVRLTGGGKVLGVPYVTFVHDAKQGYVDPGTPSDPSDDTTDENGGTGLLDGGIGWAPIVNNKMVAFIGGQVSIGTIDLAFSESPTHKTYHPDVYIDSEIDLDSQWSDGFAQSAQLDTFILGEWTFDWQGSCVDEGWTGVNLSCRGDFAGLYPGLALLQQDPCRSLLSCMWSFINGTTVDYGCGGHPEQDAVPFVNSLGRYIKDEIWSPEVAWAGYGSAANLEFDVYRDLPMNNLMFYVWHIRSIDGFGIPGMWKDRNFVYYGGNKDWIRCNFPVGDLIEATAVSVQVALGAWDMCLSWCGRYGTGVCHSHAPLFDNVELYRVASAGPQWSVRDIDLFNDTFPENGTSVGTGRIDMALDRLPSSSPGILPGDSAKVLVSDPVSGIRSPDPYTGFGGAVYFYMYRDPESSPIATTKVEEDAFRWPLVDSVVCDGHLWYQFRMDTCFTELAGPRTGPVPDAFCIDINDHYFTNGDTLLFFFGAENDINVWTWWSQGSGTVQTITEACKAPMEIQILPGEGVANGGDILYVDNFSGRGGQPYFDSAFELMGIFDQVDRFDKRGPSSLVGNSIGDRASPTQLIGNYRKIIWSCGDLRVGTVGDGTSEKADDYAILYAFLDQHTNPNGCGIYFSGDDLAEELDGMTSPASQAFKNVFMPHVLITGDHNDFLQLSPLGIGEGAGTGTPPSVGIFAGDTLVVSGGCPIINDFDIIMPVGSATIEMCYDPANEADDSNPAIIAFDTLNSENNVVGTVLSNFSFHSIRDDSPQDVPDRAIHLTKILRYLGNTLDDPTPVKPGKHFTNDLAQNYPNPFNPSTTIKYSVKANAHVSLKIYNVAGQLVRTLVNCDMTAGVYTESWNGRNNSGNPISSGVYFYKLVTKDFSMTKKMVLLK
jgi:hypothetical protein